MKRKLTMVFKERLCHELVKDIHSGRCTTFNKIKKVYFDYEPRELRAALRFGLNEGWMRTGIANYTRL